MCKVEISVLMSRVMAFFSGYWMVNIVSLMYPSLRLSEFVKWTSGLLATLLIVAYWPESRWTSFKKQCDDVFITNSYIFQSQNSWRLFNLSRPSSGRTKKIKLNFSFHSSLWKAFIKPFQATQRSMKIKI